MNIHQLSVTYLPEQDRILARVNTTAGEEMRLWLTRRLMVGLWPLLSKVMTDHLLRLEAAGSSLDSADDEMKQMLADFRKAEFLQNADFETPYQDHQPKLPLGAEPLLVTDVDAAPLASGRLRLTFNESMQGDRPGAEPRRFQIEMEPRLMQGLLHLLEQALGQSRWHESFQPATVVEDSGHADEAAPPNPPRYLN